MAEILKPGTKLSSAVCKTQIMVLRAPAEPLDISCGGQPITRAGEGSLSVKGYEIGIKAAKKLPSSD